MKKTGITVLRILATAMVIVLPFWPITEHVFPPETQVNNQTFVTYILLCLVIVLAGVILLFALKKRNSPAGWLLVAIGMVALFPLHLGPPREGAQLLAFSAIEKFRYGMLLLAVVLLFMAGLTLTAGAKITLARLFIVLLSVTVLLNIWDNFSSFMLSDHVQQWVATGKPAGDFFKQFNFHEGWRAAARISLYGCAVCMAFILLRKKEIALWPCIALTMFCLAGISFCILCIVKGFDYYFPFMVPAIALAPAYWIGVALLSNKNRVQ